MFDPRDIGEDSRQPARQKPAPDHLTRAPLDERTKAEHEKEREWQRAKSKIYRDIREKRERQGHRREYDPLTKRERIKDRTDRAVADVGIYRSVAYRDVAEAHFDGHPYAARRAVDHEIRTGNMREDVVDGPQGGTFKVLTLTEQGARRAERIAQQQGLDSEQKAWSGMVKAKELRHDVAVFRAARTEQVKLLEQGATIKRVRIDAELKQQMAREAETARVKEGKAAADAARIEAAEALGLPVKGGKVEYPDAQIEYHDVEGRTGRVNVEVATEHYSSKSITAKAAAGFAVHGSGGRATAKVARIFGRGGGSDQGGGGGRGGGRDDRGSVEI